MHWKFWQRGAVSASSPENPSTSLSNPAGWLLDYFGAGPTDAGVAVSEQSSMRTSAVYACVTLIAKTIGSLPLKVYRRRNNGDSVEVPDSLPYYLLHDEPNPVMTSCVWREFLAANMLLGGNAYAVIGRNQANQAIDLFPVHARAVTPERVDGRNRYLVRLADKSTETIDQSDMLHIPGLGYDGLKGQSVITWAARQAVGLALATEQHGSRLFSNGARLGVVLKHPKNLSKPAADRLAVQFDQQHAGLSNVARTLILEEGIDVSNVSMTSEDAQFLETRRFQVEDIARFFGVPPHMIGHTEKTSSWGTGVEQQTLGFLIFTLLPWLTRMEQEFNRKLFPRSPFYAQFKVQGLMRGDSKARSDYYASGHQNGWLTTNEIRKAEDLEPVPGGDTLFVQTNLAPMEKLINAPAPSSGKPRAAEDEESESWNTIAPKLSWGTPCR